MNNILRQIGSKLADLRKKLIVVEERVNLPRELKTGRLSAVGKHGKPNSESGLVNR